MSPGRKDHQDKLVHKVHKARRARPEPQAQLDPRDLKDRQVRKARRVRLAHWGQLGRKEPGGLIGKGLGMLQRIM